jgi:hypothetical protein
MKKIFLPGKLSKYLLNGEIVNLNMNTKENTYYREEKHFIINVVKKTQIQRIRHFVHYCLYPFYNIFYKTILTFSPKPKYDKKYKIAICSIFKNEGIFFKEWIEYHQMLGVEHFYLYNNNSEDNYVEILKEYIDKEIVTLTEWPEIPGQISAYKHWYEHYRHESQWVSFLDLDEYICPKYDTSITEWLNKFSRYPVVVMYWLMFGSSGRLIHDRSVPLIQQYTHCWNKTGRIGKVFYNTDFDIAKFNNNMHHLLNIKWKGINIPPFNDSQNAIKWSDIHIVNKKGASIQINHYWSRAFDILESKLNRGDSAYETQWRTLDVFFQKEYNNKSVSYDIYRFLLALKLRLKSNTKD